MHVFWSTHLLSWPGPKHSSTRRAFVRKWCNHFFCWLSSPVAQPRLHKHQKHRFAAHTTWEAGCSVRTGHNVNLTWSLERSDPLLGWVGQPPQFDTILRGLTPPTKQPGSTPPIWMSFHWVWFAPHPVDLFESDTKFRLMRAYGSQSALQKTDTNH